MGRLKAAEIERRRRLRVSVCARCRQEKPWAEFLAMPGRKDVPVHSWCHPCRVADYTRGNALKRERLGVPARLAEKAERRRREREMRVKTCTLCETEKPWSGFYNDPSRSDGLYPWCKVCTITKTSAYTAQLREKEPDRAREIHLRKRLKRRGLTKEAWAALVAEQNGRCALCPPTRPPPPDPRVLHLDHCHDGGLARGLLCFNHNTSMGKFGDDPAELRRAARYLEKWQRRHGTAPAPRRRDELTLDLFEPSLAASTSSNLQE